ncbi:hypothetical protein EK904_004225 [Melospiza melodia maxima]|nr:hypothetical protein EK904_004225 [Melospiza melodia maxima]
MEKHSEPISSLKKAQTPRNAKYKIIGKIDRGFQSVKTLKLEADCLKVYCAKMHDMLENLEKNKEWEMDMSDFGLFATGVISVSSSVPSLALDFQNNPSRSDGSWANIWGLLSLSFVSCCGTAVSVSLSLLPYLQRVAAAFQVDSNRYGGVLINFLGTHTGQEKNFFLNSSPELALKALPCCWNTSLFTVKCLERLWCGDRNIKETENLTMNWRAEISQNAFVELILVVLRGGEQNEEGMSGSSEFTPHNSFLLQLFAQSCSY